VTRFRSDNDVRSPRLKIRHRQLRGLGARMRQSRGQSMVEFALILPALMLVFVGCLQLGLAFFSYEQVASAANAAARAAAVNRAGDPTAAAQAAARSISPTLGLKNAQIAVSYSSTASPSGAAWTYPGTTSVTVTHPFTLSLFGLLPQSIDLTASATKRVER
jgi:Flp pilus assembly protein TadG